MILNLELFNEFVKSDYDNLNIKVSFIDCAEPLPTLANGAMIRRTVSPISATFACSPGYTAVGTNSIIHCRPGGKWSSLSYRCELPGKCIN
jgi:hypothetical protein